MADGFHVCTYLMGAPGLEHTLHQGDISEPLEHVIMGHRRLADFRPGVEHLHAQPVFGVSPDVAFHPAVVLNDIAPHQCVIRAVRGLVEKLLAQGRLGIGRLGHDEQSAGVLVDAVHQSHLGIIRVKGLQVSQVPRHGIDERAVEIAGTGMHHHARGLVHHHQRVVFIDDVEGYFLGQHRRLVLGAVEHERDHVCRPHLVVALHRFAVDKDAPRVGRRLYAVSARMLHLVGEILVYTQRCLPAIHLHAPMLVELSVVAGDLPALHCQVVIVKQVYIFCDVCHCLSVVSLRVGSGLVLRLRLGGRGGGV